MILVRLMGGLGNQMFQYAFAKHISIEKGVALKLDSSLLGGGDAENVVVRHFDLDVFGIQKIEETASKKEVERFNGKFYPTILDRISFKIKSKFSNDQLLIQKGNEINDQLLCPKGEKLCVVGRWQSERFFFNNTDAIKKIFSFSGFQPNTYSLSVAEQIRQSKSVSIHVRRGDYVTHPIYSKKLGALSLKYYLDAISLLKEKVSGNLTFYIVSDDIEWCKFNFENVNENIVFVEQEKNKLGFLSDLWLLHICQHAIISNSTFSWWGAWLGETAESVIIAPKKWSISPEFTPESIVPERWSKIDNNFL